MKKNVWTVTQREENSEFEDEDERRELLMTRNEGRGER